MLKNLLKKKAKNSPIFRKTVKRSGSVSGIGIHSGDQCTLVFHPAEPGSGILFYRKQLDPDKSYLLSHVRNVIDTSLAVTLGNAGFHVQTVEHLLFAIYVCGISDLIIEVQGGSEIPILDGSAADFVECFKSLETHEHSIEWEPVYIRQPVSVTDGNRYLVAKPSSSLKISYHIDYDHPLLQDQFIELDYSASLFEEKVAKARTFGFLKDAIELKKRGQGQGGSTENVLIYTEDGSLNEPLFQEESLYHKILDLIGDLALIGRPIVGHILGSRGGHALDVAFAKKILAHEHSVFSKAS
jgi:UDP-3-O-[3-hydroxymyristoyl] N-acetylglucosamine deacetylase